MSDIKQYIHEHVKEIWKNEIPTDYENYHLLKEDSLKNALYHHLRTRLNDAFLTEHNLRIYTEFSDGPLKKTGKRADLAIVKVEDSEEYAYIGDSVSEVIALFELKYKASYTAIKSIQEDVEKIKEYIEKDKINCQYYLVGIREIDAEQNHYINATDTWAKNRVTELTGSYESSSNSVIFSIYEH